MPGTSYIALGVFPTLPNFRFHCFIIANDRKYVVLAVKLTKKCQKSGSVRVTARNARQYIIVQFLLLRFLSFISFLPCQSQ